jgi:hypothetical protein
MEARKVIYAALDRSHVNYRDIENTARQLLKMREIGGKTYIDM